MVCMCFSFNKISRLIYFFSLCLEDCFRLFLSRFLGLGIVAGAVVGKCTIMSCLWYYSQGVIWMTSTDFSVNGTSCAKQKWRTGTLFSRGS